MKKHSQIVFKFFACYQALVIMTIFVLFSLSPTYAASEKELEVQDMLLQEGFTLPQSSINSLLNMIANGYTWDSSEPSLPYYNLQQFYPLSQKTSLKVLDFIHKAITDGNNHMDVNRLIWGLNDSSAQTQEFIEKVRSIHSLLSPSPAKFSAAVILTRFHATKVEASASLHTMLGQFVDSPRECMLVAFKLLEIGEFTKDAESVLLRYLQIDRTAEMVFDLAKYSHYEDQISDKLLESMKQSLTLFSGSKLEAMQRKLTKISASRYFVRTGHNQCGTVLGE
jgi:hypothetical protein